MAPARFGTLSTDDDALVDFGLARLRFGDGLIYFYYGDATTGRFTGCGRSPTAPWSWRGRRGGERRATRRDSRGGRWLAPATTEHQTAAYDSRERHGSRRRRCGTTWPPDGALRAVHAAGTGADGPSRALRDADGQLRGVFGVDLTIRDLRALLAGQVRDADGRAHVLDRSGAVIASTEEPAPGGEDPVLQAALAVAPTPLATLPLGQPQAFGFDYGGERWLAALQVFPLQGDVQWATAYLIPERSFLQTVYLHQRVALGLAVGLVLLAVVLAVRLSQGVARPLRLMAQDLERVGHRGLWQTAGAAFRYSGSGRAGRCRGSDEGEPTVVRALVPAEVVRDLLARGEEARLGSELRTLTIYFSDIEGFTTVSEPLARRSSWRP